MADVLVEYDGMQCMSSPPKEILEARRRRMKEREERRRAQLKQTDQRFASDEDEAEASHIPVSHVSNVTLGDVSVAYCQADLCFFLCVFLVLA